MVSRLPDDRKVRTAAGIRVAVCQDGCGLTAAFYAGLYKRLVALAVAQLEQPPRPLDARAA